MMRDPSIWDFKVVVVLWSDKGGEVIEIQITILWATDQSTEWSNQVCPKKTDLVD